jgi:hypothetical protein
MSESLKQAYSDLDAKIRQAIDANRVAYAENKWKISDNPFGLSDEAFEALAGKEEEAYPIPTTSVKYSPTYQTLKAEFNADSDRYYDIQSLEEFTNRTTVKVTTEEPLAAPDFVEYTEAVKKESTEDKNWLNEYKDNIMSRNSSSKRRQKPKYARTMFRGKTFTVNSLLDTYELIRNKEVGDVAITGSLSLFLQGKISRNKLGDLDLSTRSGSIQLDDDFEDVIMDMHYGEFGDEELVAAPRMYYINSVLVDIFPEEKVVPETLYVEYKGKEYLCVDYRHILDAKLKMLLPRMKDFKELYNKVFELNFI